MKKSNIIYLVLFIILCGYIVDIDNVFAALNASGNITDSGNGNTTACGSGGDCYSVATGGVRIALVDNEGNVVKGSTVKDYFFCNDGAPYTCLLNGWLSENTFAYPTVYFTESNMRQNLKNTATLQPAYKKIKEEQHITSIGAGILNNESNCSYTNWSNCQTSMTIEALNNNCKTSLMTGCITAEHANDTFINSYVNLNLRIPNFVYTITQRILANIKGPTYGDPQFTYLDNLLDDLKPGLNRDNLDELYYLQLEPIVQWANYGNSFGSANFVGTISEFYYFVNNIRGKSGIFSNWGSSTAFHSGNANTFFNVLGIGVFASESNHPENFSDGYDANTYSSFGDTFVEGNDPAVGVGFISLKEFYNDKCTPNNVIKYINNEKKFKKLAADSEGKWLEDYSKYGYDKTTLLAYMNDLKNAKVTTCKKPSCTVTAKNIFPSNPVKKNLNTFIGFIAKAYPNIENRFVPNDSERTSFSALTISYLNKEVYKNQMLTMLANNKFNTGFAEKYNCSAVTCEGILAKLRVNSKSNNLGKLNDINLNRLYTSFGNHLLNKSLLQTLYGQEDLDNDGTLDYLEQASCKNVDPCPVGPVTASCNKSGKITLKDTGNNVNNKCIQDGIAYNAFQQNSSVEAILDVSKTETSFDSEYGKSNSPGKCREVVEFNLPQNASTKAGKILKWGTENNPKKPKFGTMTVTRECTLSGTYDRSNITANWLLLENEGGRINPKISINYKQAVPKEYESKYKVIEEDLDIEYEQVKISIDGGKDYLFNKNENNKYTGFSTSEGKWYKISYNCGTNCSNKVKKVKVSATYNIVYGPELKWYSDKSDNYENKTENYIKTREGGVTARHYFIGYGLPTSFITPTNLEGNYYYGYSKKGNMSITITNIGTKSRNIANRYHFDNLTRLNSGKVITDDDNNNSGSIVYSCGFQIENELFGYEDEPCEEGKCEEKPKGLDVVFRTIDLMEEDTKEELKEAFPGRNGCGRNSKTECKTNSTPVIGENWSKLESDIIYGILDSKVYNKIPMYNIELNSTNIQTIRQYNRDARNKYNPYTDMVVIDSSSDKSGYVGYEFSSTGSDEDKYVYAASNFLSKLFKDGILDSICSEQKDTSKRAMAYAKTYGCKQTLSDREDR